MGVISLQHWEDIRVRSRGRGQSIKSIARDTGIARNTIRKYLRFDAPPLPPKLAGRTARLEAHADEIDALLRDEPKITAYRIIAVLQERHPEFTFPKERAARRFIARRRRPIVPREAFIRQVYRPGDQMQIDFKEVFVLVNGLAAKRRLFTARLSASGALFGRVFRAEDRAALLEGIVAACVEFGGVPRECLFDNAKTAVTRVHCGRLRDVVPEYADVCGTLGMKMVFAAPAKGNEKGGVEGAHGYIEDNFFRPRVAADDGEELNRRLLAFCRARNRELGESVTRERTALQPLPEPLPTPRLSIPVCINKFAEVRISTNRYSVPTRHAHRTGIAEVSADQVRVVVDDVVVATHPRSFGRNEAILDPLHFVDLLEYKHRAVERAEVFASPTFPQPLRALLACYVEENRDTAGRRFLAVIKLMREYSIEAVTRAAQSAQQRGTTDPAAIAILLRQGAHAYRVPEPLPASSMVRGMRSPEVNLACYATQNLQGGVA